MILLPLFTGDGLILKAIYGGNGRVFMESARYDGSQLPRINAFFTLFFVQHCAFTNLGTSLVDCLTTTCKIV
ncbi:MAG: hypothetical protein D6706_17375 [Chloroflexi bacterium]|nr:MAG: hypothetical protein D6706_17375 [Chloroflexota bacterium]